MFKQLFRLPGQVLTVLLLPLWSGPSLLQAASPITIPGFLEDGKFASFTHQQHPGNHIGYRFHEHHPQIFGEVSGTDTTSAIAAQRVTEFMAHEGVVLIPIDIESSDGGWVPQLWTFHLRPVADGIEILWVIQTADAGLNEYYAVQQCFRLGGRTNKDWRRKIAETPAFSEYDLWADETASGASLTSLTWVIRDQAWVQLPPGTDHVACRTPAGRAFDRLRTGGHPEILTDLEPYGPTDFLPDVDDGLIARRAQEGSWVCGFYWERTTHVSDHHPADCLHALVNLGPIAPRASRAIRGKIYWAQLPPDELRQRWKADFPSN